MMSFSAGTIVVLPDDESIPHNDISISHPQKISIPGEIRHDWKNLLMDGRLQICDTSVYYPKFIDFCVRAYRWFDKTFNYYDPKYVRGTGKHGKVRLLSDNWSDAYFIRFKECSPLIMFSNPYCNVGIQANYSVLSYTYSVDMNSLLTDRASKHKKMGFTLSCSRIFAEGYYWNNYGGTTIRKPMRDHRGNYTTKHFDFDGLSFKAFGIMAFYIFNYKKFSFASAYNLSNYQLKSMGSWILGANGTFYNYEFDFTKLPEALKNHVPTSTDNLKLNYKSINILGGYSYNWVINKHFLFNCTILPGVGISFTESQSSLGDGELFSATVRQMASLTYTNKQFFISGTTSFHGNMLLTQKVGLMAGIENFSFSTGVRF